ncbi:mannose-1-phosphate guanylyltransferase/mannose-6-phosphate isomerase [Hyphomicrobium sp. DMF-1]|uniref:mannose-1-phosphate guanylyltransferase/mannose-6-phosphate isomerase n=4 Tax=Hyphomicrobium TaxID=81 RepID=UPI0022EC1356|nr:mannose-1-phosphate guanylyltransferase/mannose-6-phosphate isomerase [Hyphomicrobium sp. DMF-1]WBT40080.1 mannose-1-phosphate guanylyltransferase/mannose-6-phosphate isomerase [Hyphomicrobium sp. DMF-1]
MHKIVPVILSGGSGTRLWPLSRAMYPKQFVSGLNGEKASLLSATLARLAPQNGFAAPIVVCNNAHRFLVREHAAEAGVEPESVVLEPSARNTAPAIAVAALLAARRDPAAILAIMPSDHVIADAAGFADAVRRAAEVASRGRIVLFGIAPTEPHTGYGYIRKGNALAEGTEGAFEVDSFFEKPNAETAQTYLDDGRYLWNSGIFVFRADTYLDELARHNRAVLAAAREALEHASEDLGFLRLDATAFAKAPSISVDYAVMEKTDKAAVLPLSIGWSDLGSWASLWDAAPRNAEGNFIQGDALTEDTTDCYIRSEKALISTIGVKDLVIVETPDTVLVADKSRSQDVARFVTRLKAANRKEQEQHLRSYRPWGFFETLNMGPRFQVKLLHVKPGGILSMQMHHHRSEHWVVVQGTARVTVDGTEKLVRENESVYIVATQWHRLENPGKVPLELIEVQIGTYLGEDDIIRSDDIYNRGDGETR